MGYWKNLVGEDYAILPASAFRFMGNRKGGE
jgi:hypothetical protein